ncbi:hypothetical protein NM688_g2136 [Phlebia brevispora]|uniref:Uncharacterized protein n=1 Tax=Phlebia brevispora TaxID=194682 RepID=A0ACC1T943_9APHY|nr:hypothetical protein NM688_g2136 [Phlebia brevispora]
MRKIREEQDRVRGGNLERPITLEDLDEMPYLRAMVKETLRVKPPVTMVPYKTTKAFPISDDYTVFPDPDAFKPERWLDENSSANQNPRNYLVFGSGPHKCIGLEYAMMNIAIVIADAAAMCEWEHEVTEESEKVAIIATLFPKDGCRLRFSPRQARA